MRIIVLYSAVLVSCYGMHCPSLRSSGLKLSIISQRNLTGYWEAKVETEHGDTNGLKESGPWKLDIEQSAAKCEGAESMLITVKISGPRDRPGTDYELLPGHGYYKLHTEGKTWHEALNICQTEGAHLAVMNSQEEAEAIRHLWLPHPTIFGDWRNEWAFVGFHDLYTEGNYVTIFDETLNSTGYVQWSVGEPNGGTSYNCGCIKRGSSLLGDVSCQSKMGFFCEAAL